MEIEKEVSEEVIDAEAVEPAKRKVATTPSSPTDEEVARHNETHLPYRVWCKVCVQGKARQSGHKARPVEVTERTLVQVDYCHMTCDDIAGKPKLTIFVAVENRHGEVLSLLFRRKGSSDEYIVKGFAAWLDALDSGPVIVRSDAEPANGDVVKEAVSRREEKTEAAVTEEIERGTRSCRGDELRCGESAQDNEARAAHQVPVGKSQRRKQAGGVDGKTLRVASHPIPNEGHWQNSVLLKDGQRI